MRRQKSCVLLVIIASFCLAGCGDRVEKAVREGMEEKLHVKIKSLALTKGANGNYSGTAEADNGKTYDVTANVTEGLIKWQAMPGGAALEKEIREGMEKQFNTKVKSLSLTKKQGGFGYTGTAEDIAGKKYDITVTVNGTQVQLQALPKP